MTTVSLLLRAYLDQVGGPAPLAALSRLEQEQAPKPLGRQEVARLKALASTQGLSLDEVLYHFGASLASAPAFAGAVGLPGCATLREFLVERAAVLERVVVRALAETPSARLWVVDYARDLLELGLEGRVGPLRLCQLLVGLLAGSSAHFQTPLQCREIACQHQNAPACRLLVRFPARPPVASSDPSHPAFARPSRPAFQAPAPVAVGAEAGSQEEAEVELVVLRLLLVKAQAGAGGLSLFEIRRELERLPFTAAYARAGPLTRALARLSVQGSISAVAAPGEAFADPALRRYSITLAGQEQLRHWDRG